MKNHLFTLFALGSVLFLLLFTSCQEAGGGPISLGPDPLLDEPRFTDAELQCVELDQTVDTFRTLLDAALAKEGHHRFASLLPQLEDLDSFSYLPISSRADLGNYTLFLPTDAAFEQLTYTYPDLRLSGDTLVALLNQHIVANSYSLREIIDGTDSLLTFNEEKLIVFRDESYCFYINERTNRIKIANDQCMNGVIHSINNVLLPKRYFP